MEVFLTPRDENLHTAKVKGKNGGKCNCDIKNAVEVADALANDGNEHVSLSCARHLSSCI